MFTMHGTTMIFCGHAVGLWFRELLSPAHDGARDMAFPRLNSFSFWLTAFGGFFFTLAFSEGMACTGCRRSQRRVVRLCPFDVPDILAGP